MSAKVIPRVVDQTSFLAGLIDKYKIVEHIDRLGLVADDDRTQLKIGHRVKAILLSGLGFPERTLYQAHQQFEHLNVETYIRHVYCNRLVKMRVRNRSQDVSSVDHRFFRNRSKQTLIQFVL